MATCIVIEDSARVRDVVVGMAEQLGLDVLPAANAKDGAALIQQRSAAVVLLDWDLPKLGALDILSAVAEAQLAPRPHVVLLATENEPKQFALARAAGATHYLLKPFDIDDLVGVLEGCGVTCQRAA